jgi:hypothetical protein
VEGIVYPVIGIIYHEAKVWVNFGAKPFVYQGLEEQNRLLVEDQYHVTERLELEEQEVNSRRRRL